MFGPSCRVVIAILVVFYDPIRLSQDLEEEVKLGNGFIGEPGLIVIPEVTWEHMESAVCRLFDEGYFESFKSVEAAVDADAPKSFDFTQPYWDGRKLKPKDSERFRIIGYEAGAFFGHVEGESEIERNWAARTFEPFGFHSSFEVRSIDQPERMRVDSVSGDAE